VGFAEEAEGHLGLGYDQALACVDRSAWSEGRIADMRRPRPGAADRPGVRRLFPEAADDFFTGERLRPDPVSVLQPAFSVIVVTAGTGLLEAEHAPALGVRAGDTVLVPYGAGSCVLRGSVDAVRCAPAAGAA
jgi:mannose-6-phosphate isomerase